MLHCTHFEIKQLLHAFLILSVVYYLPRSAVCLTRKVLYLVFEAGFTCSARHHSRQGVWWFYSLKCTGEQATGIFVGIVITHPEMKITYFLINFLFTSLSVMVGLSLSKLARPTIPAIAHYFGTKGRYEEVNPHLLDDILSVNRSLLVPPLQIAVPFIWCRWYVMGHAIQPQKMWKRLRDCLIWSCLTRRVQRLGLITLKRGRCGTLKTWTADWWKKGEMTTGIWRWDWHSHSPPWFLRISSAQTALSSSPAPSTAVLIVLKLSKRVCTDSGMFRVGLMSLLN